MEERGGAKGFYRVRKEHGAVGEVVCCKAQDRVHVDTCMFKVYSGRTIYVREIQVLLIEMIVFAPSVPVGEHFLIALPDSIFILKAVKLTSPNRPAPHPLSHYAKCP